MKFRTIGFSRSFRSLPLIVTIGVLSSGRTFGGTSHRIVSSANVNVQPLSVVTSKTIVSFGSAMFAAAPGLSGAAYQKALREKNILIRYFNLPRTKDFTRITIGTQAQMECLIEATKEILP